MFRNYYRLARCGECGTKCLQRRRAPRHSVHLILTIATFGLWGICWVITIIAARWEPWRCRECRRPQLDVPARRPLTTAVDVVGSHLDLVHQHFD